jgi:hypothetical protein
MNEGPYGCVGTDCKCGSKDWFSVHCYHCGRRFDDIAIDGATPNCLCDQGDGHTISDTEYDELRGAK